MAVDTGHSTLSAADRTWFGERVEETLPELFGTAVRLCGDQMEAEDLVAASVAKAWEALPKLRDRSAFRGWMFRILNNTFISHCRSARSQAVHEPIDDAAEEPFSLFERLHQPFLLWWGNPEIDFLNRLVTEDLQRAVDSLPQEFRHVVVLVDMQGFAYQEAAEVLDVPIGTVRSRLSRGRGLLQEALWAHAVDAGLRKGGGPAGDESGTSTSETRPASSRNKEGSP